MKPEQRLRVGWVALWTVAWARAALWWLPWRRAHGWVLRLPVPALRGIPAPALSRAVQRAARLVPRASCLTQALALQRLLRAAGRRGEIHIGVSGAGDAFRAHAWVESDGETLLSNRGELLDYVKMLTLFS